MKWKIKQIGRNLCFLDGFRPSWLSFSRQKQSLDDKTIDTTIKNFYIFHCDIRIFDYFCGKIENI